MAGSMIERRLTEVSDRLKQLRIDLQVADEQHAHFAHEAEDARIRSLVSETPAAVREHREAQKHADAMARHHVELAEEITRLEQSQDDLLDRLIADGGPS